MDQVNLVTVDLCELRGCLESAAAMVKELYLSDRTASFKENGTPLTRADTQVNQFLRHALTLLYPKAGWLSEESADDLKRLDFEWLWIVDPLDGTKEFVRGIPEFAISVGLVHHNEVILGGILNPITQEGGVGTIQGQSNFWGFLPRTCPARNLDEVTASVSRSEVEDGSITPYLSLVRETHPIGSVAYKLLRVAVGVEDLTFSIQPKSEWDICGGIALLAATGKTFRRFDERPCRFNQISTRILCGSVAGPAALASEFLTKRHMTNHTSTCISKSTQGEFNPDN